MGVMTLKDAIALAEEREEDLIEISPTANPPVCKIMNYGKYKFEVIKRDKEAKKKQKIVVTKEIRMSVNIDTNDIRIKANKAKEILQEGDKLKVAVVFSGREMAHMDLGHKVLEVFMELLDYEGYVTEKSAMVEGRSIMTIISPKK